MGNTSFPDTIRIEPTAFTVCGLPPGPDASVWSIRVEATGAGMWAVRNLSRCLSKSGKWDLEPIPSERSKAWLTRHRFTLDEALERAVEVYPSIAWNGLRVENGQLVPSGWSEGAPPMKRAPVCPEHGGPADDCEECAHDQWVADDQATDEDWYRYEEIRLRPERP